MTKVLVAHAYSARNAGDGLLVRETLSLVRQAFGNDVELALLAHEPETFQDLGLARVAGSKPGLLGYPAGLVRTLRRLDEFDLIVAVGGGYLRADSLIGALKLCLAHGPQLACISRSSTPSIYMPQSIGPVPRPIHPVLVAALRRVDIVMVRDDKSLLDVGGIGPLRMGDLALRSVPLGRRPGASVDPTPVLSVRAVHGRLDPRLLDLARRLREYDSYVQSTTGGNDDRPATARLSPRSILGMKEMFEAEAEQRRVVVAVRLHAALMALAAGHYVVHLAYERKGFGAFRDLALDPWVHNLRNWSVDEVTRQVKELASDSAVRRDYDQAIAGAWPRLHGEREDIVGRMRKLVGCHGVPSVDGKTERCS